MQFLKNTPASTLYWIQPRWVESEYELRSYEELYCKLKWAKISLTPASVVSADGQWTLIADYWRRTVRVESSDGDAIAICKIGRFGHKVIVEFSNSSRLRFDMNGWRSEYAFHDEDTDDLLSFKVISIFWPLKLKVRVNLAQRLKDKPEATLLAALGLYLLTYNLQFHNSILG
jgi:hypothetical protein